LRNHIDRFIVNKEYIASFEDITPCDRAGTTRRVAQGDVPMHGSRIAQLALSVGLICAAVWSFAQTGQNPGGQQTPVVRATTRMVVVNVVVHDKQGVPISGLTRDDFTVLDGGQKQLISSFSAESRRTVHGLLQPLPLNTFSNHVNREGGVPASVAVILLDGLNTPFEYLPRARQQLTKFLSQLQPGDRVALYVLGRQLRVVQDFTSDPAPLLEALRHEAVTLGAVPSADGLNPDQTPASKPSGLSGPAAEAATRFESSMADWTIAGPDLHRDLYTCEVIAAIANHLTGLPGRKSLIWVTGGVPVLATLSTNVIPRPPDPRLEESYARMVRALNDADVAIYPVDARGLFVDPHFTAANPGEPDLGSGDSSRAMAAMNDKISFMVRYAAQTGGRAFYDTNDLQRSLRSALEDSELTYTLGYYPSDARWDGRYRSIKVLVDRPGVQVRHRQGYLATAVAPPEKTDRLALLKEAAASPLDATALGVTVALKPLENSGEGKFQVTVKIDPGGVTFQPANGARSVLVDVLAGPYSSQGKSLGGVQNTLSADLNEKSYEKVMREGLNLTFPLSVEPGAEELRVVARDDPSGAVGSVKIPLSKVPTALAVPPEPATRQMPSSIAIPANQPPHLSPESPAPPGTGTWRLTGRVTNPDNEPLAGVRVKLQLANGAKMGTEVETNPQGLFEARVPVPAADSANSMIQVVEVMVLAGKEGYSEAQKFVELQADNGPPLGLVLQDDERRANLLTPEALIAAMSRHPVSFGPKTSEASDIYRRRASKLFQKRQAIAAIPTLQSALALDPSCVACKFLLGLAHFDAGDWTLARSYFTNAAGLDTPEGTGDKLPGPLVALAVLNMWQGDRTSAERLLNAALQVAPGDGLALEELGRLKMFRQDWAGAKETLREAVRKGAPPDVHLLRAKLDLDQDDLHGAVDELRQYIRETPELMALKSGGTRLHAIPATLPLGASQMAQDDLHVAVPGLQQYFQEARESMTLKSGGTRPHEQPATFPLAALQITNGLADRMRLDNYGKVKTMVTQPLAELVSKIPELKGIEPAQNQEPITSLMNNVGEIVRKFISEVPDTISDEIVQQERLSEKGQAKATRERSYQYLVLVHAANDAHTTSTKEYRTGQDGKEAGEDYVGSGFFGTEGFAVAIPMIFDPRLQPGTDFRLLGTQSVAGHETQVVAFAQRPKESSLVHHYRSRYGSIAFLIQGIAWVDIHSYQIVQARTGLLKPLDQVRLKEMTTSIQLAETKVQGSPNTFWLPQKVNVFVNYDGHAYRDRHTYSNFRLFKAESTIRAADEKVQ
jgi:VWFA-related protein